MAWVLGLGAVAFGIWFDGGLVAFCGGVAGFDGGATCFIGCGFVGAVVCFVWVLWDSRGTETRGEPPFARSLSRFFILSMAGFTEDDRSPYRLAISWKKLCCVSISARMAFHDYTLKLEYTCAIMIALFSLRTAKCSTTCSTAMASWMYFLVSWSNCCN